MAVLLPKNSGHLVPSSTRLPAFARAVPLGSPDQTRRLFGKALSSSCRSELPRGPDRLATLPHRLGVVEHGTRHSVVLVKIVVVAFRLVVVVVLKLKLVVVVLEHRSIAVLAAQACSASYYEATCVFNTAADARCVRRVGNAQGTQPGTGTRFF